MGEVFETTDLETVEHVLSDTYGKMRLSAPGASGALRMSQTPVSSSVRLDRVTFTMSLEASVSQLGVLVFGELKSGRLRFESGRSDRRFGPGGVYFAAQPDHPYAATMEETVLEQAVLDAAGGADACDLQRHDPQTAALVVEAQRGLRDEFAVFFASAGPARKTASTAAVISRQAVIVDDIDHSPVYRGRRVLDAMRAAGIRAVHSYPLPDAGGEVRGVLSLYYWRRSAQRDVSSLIAAAAAQALRRLWDEPGSGPGREPDQLGVREAG